MSKLSGAMQTARYHQRRVLDHAKYQYLKLVACIQNMSFRFLLCLICLTIVSSCSVTSTNLWSCVLQKYDYSNRGCVSAKQLYTAIKSKTSTFTRAVIIAVEGPKYRRLFHQCDVNRDNCLSTSEMEQCKRSCVWKQTAYSLLCKN